MDRMMNYARAFWVAGATAMLLGFGAPAWAVINLTPDTTAATPEMAGKGEDRQGNLDDGRRQHHHCRGCDVLPRHGHR